MLPIFLADAPKPVSTVAASIAPKKPTADDDELRALRKQVVELKVQVELCNIVLERYRKFIEDSESKSISELRELVKPLDSTITELKINIEDQFHPYVYDANFLVATQKAMDMIFAWKKVKAPLSFWMAFSDMARLHAADDIDRAILFCSLFRALGSDSARVLIGKDKSAWTSFAFNKKQYVINVSGKTMSAYAAEEDALRQFMYQMQYEFNDKEYHDFSD